MKPFIHLVNSLAAALLCAVLTGCASDKMTVPLAGGYEEVAHPHRIPDESTDVRVSFQHRTADGKITRIWPSLYGVDEVIQGDTAIFVGDVSYVSSNPEDPRGTRPRLFAVRSPAPPTDITDEILWRWTKTSGKSYDDARQLFRLATPSEKDGQLELQLEFWTEARDWPDKAVLQLDWNQVSAIMSEVKTKGTLHKDLHWKTPYLAK
jgi:hypothetical protein